MFAAELPQQEKKLSRHRAEIMDQLLPRVDLDIDIEELLHNVAAEYALGEVVYYEPIGIGYEELNIKLTTKEQIYVVKIFSQDKTRNTIQDYTRGMIEFRAAGIPVPKLFKCKDDPLYKAVGVDGDTYLCVMEFFEGKAYTEIEPTEDDLRILTDYLAKIHTLSFEIGPNYDSWGTAHLIEEYQSKREYLSHEDIKLVTPVVDEFREIDFSKFRECIVHGDLQRSNILKSTQGTYCILDFGSMTFAAAAIDLAIFLAVFCFDADSIEKNRMIYSLVIKQYQETLSLSMTELSALPVLVKATYAIYLVASNYAVAVRNDKSAQTQDWLALSRKGLSMFSHYQLDLD